MQDTLAHNSPYLTAQEGAAYLRRTAKTLERWTLKYSIPRYGPKKNLYRVDDLDAFMLDCHCFTSTPEPTRAGAGYTPVSV